MRLKHFGDSYDVVKLCLLRWLRDFGEWSVHPMLTEHFPPEKVAAFESMLGLKVISTDVISLDTDRSNYFSGLSSFGHLFLDPDTGLRLRPTRGLRAPEYLFGHEFLQLVNQRPASLTLVFDQSIGRGSEEEHVKRKLHHFLEHDVFGFAYVSHACFVLASLDHSLVERARKRVLSESRLPSDRFISASDA